MDAGGYKWNRYVLVAIFAAMLRIPFAYGIGQLGIDRTGCEKLLHSLAEKGISHYGELKPKHLEFVKNVAIPFLGRRFLEDGNHNPRLFGLVDDEIFYNGFPGEKTLSVKWLPGVKVPYLDLSSTRRTLVLPEDFEASKLSDQGRTAAQTWTLGHSLQPFTPDKASSAERVALGEPAIFPKPTQIEGVQAAKDTIAKFEAGDKSSQGFLFVGPTGVGKTLVLTEVLKERLKSDLPLHILTADTDMLVQQLKNDVESMQGAAPYHLIQWGGDAKKQTLNELLAFIKTSDRPVILVTTTQSLKARVGKTDALIQKNGAKLRALTGSFVYDEAHHSRAAEIRKLMDELIHGKGSRVFAFGTTATPFHSKGVIGDLFSNRAFWAYIDNVESFNKNGGALVRPFATVLEQVRRATRQGELTPLLQIFRLDPLAMEKQGLGKVFIKAESEEAVKEAELHETEDDADEGSPAGKAATEKTKSSRFKINPRYYSEITKELSPLLKLPVRGFIALNSIQEVHEFTKHLKLTFPKRRFAEVYSGMTRAEQTALYTKLDPTKRGAIDFIVTVKKIDEGFNHPALSLYIDLTHSVGERQKLQRRGRILRLHLGKEEAIMAAFDHADERDMELGLTRLQGGQIDEQPSSRVAENTEVVHPQQADLNRVTGYTPSETSALKPAEFWTPKAQQPVLGPVALLSFWNPLEGTLPALEAASKKELGRFARKFGARDYLLSLAAKLPDAEVSAALTKRLNSIKWDERDGEKARRHPESAERIYEGLKAIAETLNTEYPREKGPIDLEALYGKTQWESLKESLRPENLIRKVPTTADPSSQPAVSEKTKTDTTKALTDLEDKPLVTQAMASKPPKGILARVRDWLGALPRYFRAWLEKLTFWRVKTPPVSSENHSDI